MARVSLPIRLDDRPTDIVRIGAEPNGTRWLVIVNVTDRASARFDFRRVEENFRCRIKATNRGTKTCYCLALTRI